MGKNSFIFEVYSEHAAVYYGKHTSVCGEVVVLATERGICGLHFLDKSLAYYLQLAEKKFNVLPVHAPSYTQDWWQCIHQTAATPSLVIQGTAFQRKVWQFLCTIPVGTTASYQALATQLGLPRAARAVASAIAQNFIAWLIPCHRVVRQNGQISGYRWGVQNKITLLKREKDTMMGSFVVE
jgi:AraC family transcriptional regulator, regulatory protein of adaptative response / methylated-DNA-[protein]-cysteine methyltransferase